jgi:sporulation protein YlmC with PRC-barrel domain
MKRTGLFLTTLVLAALLLAACGGQGTSTSQPGTNVPPATVQATSTEMSTSVASTETPGTADLTTTPNVPVTGENSANRISKLLDYDVWNQNGDQIGKMDDVVLNFDKTNISYAVIGTGGFLGIGEKEVLVPWNLLQVQTAGNGPAGDQNAIVYTGDQNLYQNYPDVDLSTLLPRAGQPAADWDAAIQNYWQNGGNGAAIGQATSTPAGGADLTATPGNANGATAATQTTPGAGVQKMQGVVLASDLLGSTVRVYDTGKGAGNGQNQGMVTETPAAGQAVATNDSTGAAAGTAVATDTVSGMGIANTLGTMDATVDDAIVDPNAGAIQYLVVTGAFTGGQRTVPVPVKYLNWDAANQKFSLGVNSLALVNAPAFDKGQYPDFSSNDWSTKLDSYWNNLKSDMLNVTPAP